MKVLLVNGGPHKDGCTNAALSEVAKALNNSGISTEIMHLGVEPIAGCIGCGACNSNGKCFRNDIVNLFVEKAKDFDGFIFGSPVHFAAASGSLTSFMDRVFMIKASQLANKPAAAIVSCRRGGATAALDQINKYFTIRCMPIVASNYWNMVHGSTAEDVKQDVEGLQTMRILGQNMAWLLKCIEAAKQQGIAMPIAEQKVYTNFIR